MKTNKEHLEKLLIELDRVNADIDISQRIIEKYNAHFEDSEDDTPAVCRPNNLDSDLGVVHYTEVKLWLLEQQQGLIKEAIVNNELKDF